MAAQLRRNALHAEALVAEMLAGQHVDLGQASGSLACKSRASFAGNTTFEALRQLLERLMNSKRRSSS